MFNFVRRILNKHYHFLNRIEIQSESLRSNFKYLSSLNKKISIAPVLKSNAYGHGLVEVGQILDQESAPFYCVDSLHEAYRLQKAGVKTPILIMGYINPENLKVKKLPFAYAVYDLQMAMVINQYQPAAKVHLKIDTGMHRLGVPIDQLDSFLAEISKLKNLQFEGVMSHFASAKSIKDPLFIHQMKNFKQALKTIKSAGINPKWVHIAATEALLNPEVRKQIASISNLARAGKSLYGYALYTEDSNLKPVLILKSHIAQIKTVQRGEIVGYDGTYKAKKNTAIALLPIGYNDGVDRRLSNKGVTQIDGHICPIIGRVSMNITAIDINLVPESFVGQEVTIYSNNPQDPNSITQTAIICDTIPHEVLVHLDPITKRIIV